MPGEELLCTTPVAYRPRIEMDELRIGIVADSALVEVDGGLVNSRQFPVRQAEVDGSAIHVQGVFGDATAGLTEFPIGLCRSVAGDDMQGVAVVESVIEEPELVEQPVVDPGDLAATMVAKDVVNGAQRVELVVPFGPIVDVLQFFASMRVEKGELTCRQNLIEAHGQQRGGDRQTGQCQKP